MNFGRLGGLADRAGGDCAPRLLAFFQRALDREHPPARVTATQAADLLGFEKDDLALLAAQGLLRPLGEPAPNAVKYYALTDVAAFGEDRERLAQATEMIYRRNRTKVATQNRRLVAADA